MEKKYDEPLLFLNKKQPQDKGNTMVGTEEEMLANLNRIRNPEAIKNFQLLYNKYQDKLDTTFISSICNGDDHAIESREWELLLNEFISSQNLICESADNGPDFKITSSKTGKIWMEAICPNIQDSRNEKITEYVSLIHNSCEFLEIPEEALDLVLTGAMKEKKEKFDKYRKMGVVNDNDIAIIAISCAAFPLPRVLASSGHGLPRIVKVCYGLGRPYVSLNTVSGDTREGIEIQKNIQNHNNSPVPKDMFLNSSYEDISAILVSASNIMKTTLDDAVLVHNPHAKNKLPFRFFKGVTEYYVHDGKLAYLS